LWLQASLRQSFFESVDLKDCGISFGASEYDRAVKEDGSRQHAKAGLNERTARVESLNIRPLAPGDRARFLDAWRRVEARFVECPGGAVTEGDQLLGDVDVHTWLSSK